MRRQAAGPVPFATYARLRGALVALQQRRRTAGVRFLLQQQQKRSTTSMSRLYGAVGRLEVDGIRMQNKNASGRNRARREQLASSVGN